MSLPEQVSEFGMCGKQIPETIFIIIFEATINTKRFHRARKTKTDYTKYTTVLLLEMYSDQTLHTGSHRNK